MFMNTKRLKRLALLFSVAALCAASDEPVLDWPESRGPNRNGISNETNLPEKWSLSGQNLAWKAPYGGRSAPIVVGDHLYLQNSAGTGETQQERVMCFNADTGKLLWEYKFNVFQSDVPPHRIAWASPAADVAGNVFVFGANGTLLALTKDGKLIWERSLDEEFDLFTTHGGRTTSPIIEGNLVIVKAASSTWGTQANRSIRFMAFDRLTGETVWVSTPGGRPFDTDYSQPLIARINGTRLLIAGLGDGGVHAVKANTGEPVWHFLMSKRAINTAPVLTGTTIIASHGQENLDGNEMGMLAAIDATAKGNIAINQAKWVNRGFIGEFSSGVVDGDHYLQIDNGSNLYAFDVTSGRQLWKQNLGTVQKSSLVLGDSKLYVGTESGKFYIIKPHADRCEILSEVELPISQQGLFNEKVPEPVVASAAISRGRVYFVSSDTLYAIGKKAQQVQRAASDTDRPTLGQPAWVQVVPTEVVLTAGQTANFRARLFDEHGEFLREEQAAWALDGLKGSIDSGRFTSAGGNSGQAGQIKATVGAISGMARVRVVPPLPWTETFDSYDVGATPPHWVGATAGQYKIAELDGQKVLAKAPNETLFKRMRIFLGPTNWSNYTVEADVRAPEKRRQLGDAGVTAQRYTLVLFGNNQQLTMYSWQPQTASNVSVPFAWKPDTWYHLKLRVENTADGKTRVLGKAWPTAGSEPAAWIIDRVDPIPNRQGSPGLFGDATSGVFFDNLKVTAN
jgi:outer membrane protein assembly factor BamB